MYFVKNQAILWLFCIYWFRINRGESAYCYFLKLLYKMANFLIFCHKIRDFAKDLWQLFFLFWRVFREYEIDITDLLAQGVIGGADAESWEVFGAKLSNTGFEAIIAASATLFAKAKLAKV